MYDVISRHGVINFINDIEHSALKMSNDNSEDILYKTVLATTKAIRGYCKIVPSAQPKTGKWIPWKYHDGFRCEYCNEPVDNKHNFCPNCGAKMEGVKE